MPNCATTRLLTPGASSRMGLAKGDRLALIAETGAEFAACFFGAIYAGLWPVPLPLPTSFGGRDAYVDQLDGACWRASDPPLFLYPPELAEFADRRRRAARRCNARDWDSLAEVEPSRADLPPPDADEIAYLQYSSGSTRFPHGVAVTHRALLDNLRAHGIGVAGRRTATAASAGCPGITTWAWSAACCRRSPTRSRVDYLKTEDFARRPLAWLDLISRNPGTTLSYSPTFGYDICARRMSSQTARRRPLRPVALAHRRQWRRHDPPRRHAGVRRQPSPTPGSRRQLSARATASPKRRWRSRSCRRARASASSWSRKPNCRAAAPPAQERPRRYRAIVNCGKPVERHGGRDPRTTTARRLRRPRRSARCSCRGTVDHGRLFPRRGSDRRLPATTVGSTPATWATCRAATSSSSAAPRT